MSFDYKNPISPNQLVGQTSVDRTKTVGTNFSILSTGGFMEVYSLSQLLYTIPPSTYGPIEFTGNTIPITFSKGSGTTFSYDTLTLHSDNLSSGRRKQGMLVYVKEEDQIYQYNIDNYFSLWSAATGSSGTVIFNEFGTIIKGSTPEGIAFISGWTANTIDGVSGVTRNDAVWKKYYGTNLAITGGTYDIGSGTLNLTNITGGTVSITGFGFNYTYVSGSSYSATTIDSVIGVDSSISATTIYLPDSISSGRIRYEIKDIGLNSFTNNITIISAGSDTIISVVNSNTVTLGTDGGALIFFNTGAGTWLQM